MLIHQNQVSRERWRRRVCAQTSAPSRKLASCPATFQEEDGCPATTYSPHRIPQDAGDGGAGSAGWGCRVSQQLALVPGLDKTHFTPSLLKELIRLTASRRFGSRCCELVLIASVAFPLPWALKAAWPA